MNHQLDRIILITLVWAIFVTAIVSCGPGGSSAITVQPPAPTPTLEPTFTPLPPANGTFQSAPTGVPLEPTPIPTPVSRLSGRIVDQETGRPVAEAQVNAGRYYALTDAEGRFRLVNLSPGQYVLSVTHHEYDPAVSGIFTIVAGEEQRQELGLYAPDTSPYPEDPMLTNPLDPNGAPTAADAERLAREQGLAGQVTSIREITLNGEYLVNYKIGDDIRAAVAKINHEAWELTDNSGRSWWIIKVCGNLASSLPGEKPIATPKPIPLPPMAEVLAGLVVRECASEDCSEVGSVPAGEAVEVFGCLVGGGWCEVGWSGGRGWCTGESLRQLAVAEAVPVVTEASAYMTRQLGFSDEHVELVASQGFELQTVREIEIDGQFFIAFYFLRDYKPRILNDFATTILIYRGTPSKIDSFVHRIDVREPVEYEQITVLPDPTGWSLTIPFASNVLIAYEVAGFNFRALKTSTDSQGTNYKAIITYLNDSFHAITFEETSETQGFIWLETYFLPELPAPGKTLDNSRLEYTFDEAWVAAQADFVPSIRAEKALYALGCNFSKGEENTLGVIGKFGEKQAYNGKEYVLYTCTLLTDYDPGWAGMDFQSNNFVAVYEFDGQVYRRLWNTLYLDTSTFANWGDKTGDQIPELVIDKERASTGTGATYRGSFEAGHELFQLTSNGNLVDLLVDEAGNKLDFAEAYSIGFSDLDDDGVNEIVVESIAFGLYGGKRMESLYTTAIRKIYRLNDDLYYVQAEREFEFLCQNSIEGLIQPDGSGSDLIMMGFSAYTTLVTCDAIGMRQEAWEVIKLEAEKFAEKMKSYPEGCRNWLRAVYQDLALKAAIDEELPLFETDKESDWDTLFSEAYKQGCRI